MRFAYQAFKALKVSQSLLELHGKQEQNKRTAIYFQFVEKKHAVLFSTDISARGVDFPAVDWVIQVDCPEDTSTYIHRVGRTARYKSKGNALLMLLPGEAKFADKLRQRNIEMKKLATKADKQLTIQPALEKLNAENRDQMHLAKSACASYLKGIHVMRDKEVFSLASVDAEKLARSYGLLNAPQLTVVTKKAADAETGEVVDKKAAAQERILRLRMEAKARKVQKHTGETEKVAEKSEDEEDDDEDDFFKEKAATVKGAGDGAMNEDEDSDEEDKELPALSKRALRKIRPEGPYAGKNKVMLDAEGKATTKTESDYMTALRQGDGWDQGMVIEADADVSDDAGKREQHLSEVRKSMAKN